MLNDSLPLCDFAFPQLVRPLANRAEWEASDDISGDIDIGCRIFSAVTGIDISDELLTNILAVVLLLGTVLLIVWGGGGGGGGSSGPSSG